MFKDINAREYKKNPFAVFNDDWALLCAGDKDKYNMMTVSWGGMGVLWHKNVAFVFARPSRLTYDFLENNDYFSLTFFDEGYKDMLTVMGKNSGRDIDKMNYEGLTPFTLENSVGFEEGHTVIECKKMYFQDMEPSQFIDSSIMDCYPGENNFHRIYVGEILRTLVK